MTREQLIKAEMENETILFKHINGLEWQVFYGKARTANMELFSFKIAASDAVTCASGNKGEMDTKNPICY